MESRIRPYLLLCAVSGIVSLLSACGSINNADKPEPPEITTASVPNGTVGASYTSTLTATSGTAPYTWSVSSGALPTGLTLSSAGTISGTPTISEKATFSVEVTDSESSPQTGIANLSITVVATQGGVVITTTTLPQGNVNTGYSSTLSASGGTTPYTWSIVSGALPGGLALNSATGAITGMPHAKGTFKFVAQVLDSEKTPTGAQSALSIVVAAQAFTETDYPVGGTNYGVAAADLNGDGSPDIVVAAANTLGVGVEGVRVLLGNGDGTFRSATMYQAGDTPFGVVIGDFNGDEIPDIAVSNYGSGTVSVLLGNGDGTFRPHIDTVVDGAPVGIAAGDFNGDGKLDIAVPNYKNNTVTVWLGNGNGTFQPPVDYDAGYYPAQIVVADFNRDGKLDLAIVQQGCPNSPCTGPSYASIYLGNGDGTFQTHKDYLVGEGTTSDLITTADLNGDGIPDLVVGNFSTNSFSVLIGNGDGTFKAPVDYPSGQSPRALTTGDFNGDGKMDVLVGAEGATGCPLQAELIFLGNGDGTFQLPTTLCVSIEAISAVSRDLNKDGTIDFVTGGLNSANISVFLNGGYYDY